MISIKKLDKLQEDYLTNLTVPELKEYILNLCIKYYSYLSYNYLDHDEADKLNYIFDYIDKDKDNKITEEDLIIAFNNKVISSSEILPLT